MLLGVTEGTHIKRKNTTSQEHQQKAKLLTASVHPKLALLYVNVTMHP